MLVAPERGQGRDGVTLMCHLEELEPGAVVGRTGWCGGVEVRLAA